MRVESWSSSLSTSEDNEKEDESKKGSFPEALWTAPTFVAGSKSFVFVLAHTDTFRVKPVITGLAEDTALVTLDRLRLRATGMMRTRARILLDVTRE